MEQVLVSDAGDNELLCCKPALKFYEVVGKTRIRDCVDMYQTSLKKPELMLTSMMLKDGSAKEAARVLNEIALVKVIVIVNKGIDVDNLYYDSKINNVVFKPVDTPGLGKLIARTINKCVICHGHDLGNYRELHCKYCNGSGKFTEQGYAFLRYHVCHCCTRYGFADCLTCDCVCHCKAHV